MSDVIFGSLAFINLPGGMEWVVIGVIALLLFGRRLPEIMRGLGGSVREFKKGMEDGPAAQPPAAQPPVAGAVSRDAAPVPPVNPPGADR